MVSGAARLCEYELEQLPLLSIFHQGFVQTTIFNVVFHGEGCRSNSARQIMRPENPTRVRTGIR